MNERTPRPNRHSGNRNAAGRHQKFRKGGPHNARPKKPEVEAPDTGPRPQGHAARLEAIRQLNLVLEEEKTLTEAAVDAPAYLAPADRARAGTLAASVMRYKGQIDDILRRFAHRAPPAAPRDALRMAAVEALALDIPAHAALDGAVAAVKDTKNGARYAGLVNAVGRKVMEEGPAIWAEQNAVKLNVEGWLRGRLGAAYGGKTGHAIAAAHMQEPPIDLTLKDQAHAEGLAKKLGAELLPTGSLRLTRPGQLTALPGHAEGDWWVQDAAAALPARLLHAKKGDYVLDMCAAPGGKTMQLASTGAEVDALDISKTRLGRVRENLKRTKLEADLNCANALEFVPPSYYDAILLDAPCSATGTVRRHPELPYLRHDLDLAGLTELQDKMFDKAWSWLKPGGTLVFATCSLLPQEGEKRAKAFAERHEDAQRSPISADEFGGEAEWITEAGELRTRPDFWADRGGMDGFFAVRFTKAAEEA